MIHTLLICALFAPATIVLLCGYIVPSLGDPPDDHHQD